MTPRKHGAFNRTLFVSASITPVNYDDYYGTLFVNVASTSMTSTSPPTFGPSATCAKRGSPSATAMQWPSAPRGCRAVDNGTSERTRQHSVFDVGEQLNLSSARLGTYAHRIDIHTRRVRHRDPNRAFARG
jgi:hypothetical protein